ncbi:hypothetical protein [Tamlana crocina]|uniref:Uncharacterized protein n=1 Tax=Tamlana crocina TaxID=393006 RepID=A0ABX1D703_9FLAO|nr:hypothetical protein [Tamlana crocina]NJX14085.1 hypothetical protein [Tamlana crocina]
MNAFISIMLIIILVLIISDVFFLWKIFKNIGKRKKGLPDERYFELKYNINLLKAVSAILIFLVGFLGFNSYNNITENIDKDFSEKLEKQNARIDILTTKLRNYESLVDSLEVKEGESVKNLGEINQQFVEINNKIKQIQEDLKYTTKVYVVRDLKFYPSLRVGSRKESQTYWFKEMSTIYGERLPKFKSKPLITLEGKSINLDIAVLTKDYIKIGSGLEHGYDEDEPDPEFYYFDMWIAEPN